MPFAAALPQQPLDDDYCATHAGHDALALRAKLAAGEESVMQKIADGNANFMEAASVFPGDKVEARAEGASAAAMTFNTYVHIIQSAAGTSPASGYISRQQIDAQMRVLNQQYAIANVSFNYVNTSYTVNSRWASAAFPGNAIEREMKPRLRIGGRLDLNLFYIPGWRGSGVCRFPDWIGRNDENLSIDGCMSASDSFPDGSRDRRGFLTVHEVGHWMGLFHTFQGDFAGECNEVAGDYVADTPASAGPNRGCPVGTDSCPRLPGLDPIENHMDYTSESCKTGFTPGQAERMRQMVLMFRYAKN
ncbi:hypothetical protein V2A60_003543 [Cordyceps javanica]|uniref:Metalloprotease MEP1-like protein n=1 Tax=Cordyceps javanica TaxID=43265 RepID=A0A545UUJ4_9HYPO|nr:metalloprotease MEP1-like protein [Cordyceps javanica]TQW05044.1 metalloprotease MEP1-like protein [Cordyceps javanica]